MMRSELGVDWGLFEHLLHTQVIMRVRTPTTNTAITTCMCIPGPLLPLWPLLSNPMHVQDLCCHCGLCCPIPCMYRTFVAIVAFVVQSHACRPSHYPIDPTLAPRCTTTGTPPQGITKPHPGSRVEARHPHIGHGPSGAMDDTLVGEAITGMVWNC